MRQIVTTRPHRRVLLRGNPVNTSNLSRPQRWQTCFPATPSANAGILLTVLLALWSTASSATEVTLPSGTVTLNDGWLYSYAYGEVNVIDTISGPVPFYTYTSGSPTASDSAESITTSPASVSNGGYSATGTSNYGTSGAIASAGPVSSVRDSAFQFQSNDIVPSASAGSSWGDGFVITGGTGQGTATVNVSVTGMLYAGPKGGAYEASYFLYYSDATCSASPDGCPYTAWDNDPNKNSNLIYVQPAGTTQSVSENLSLTFDFTYDMPFTLESYLDLAVTYSATADFSHTAKLLDFSLPTGTTLYDATGTFDTGSATPLPAALPLLASGLGGLGLLGWRRKRKTAALAA